jgi:hypothetical protein
MRTLSLMLVLLAAGCDSEPELTHYDEVDPYGIACVEPDAAADDVLTVVIQQTCFSGSTMNMDASCSVETDGQTLTVSALYSYDQPDQMTADCGDVRATCTTDTALVAGSYTLVYAGSSVAVEVPRADRGEGSVCTD